MFIKNSHFNIQSAASVKVIVIARKNFAFLFSHKKVFQKLQSQAEAKKYLEKVRT